MSIGSGPDLIGAFAAVLETADIPEGCLGDVQQCFAGEKSLLAGDQDIGESEEAHKDVIVDDPAGQAPKKDAGFPEEEGSAG